MNFVTHTQISTCKRFLPRSPRDVGLGQEVARLHLGVVVRAAALLRARRVDLVEHGARGEEICSQKRKRFCHTELYQSCQ